MLKSIIGKLSSIIKIADGVIFTTNSLTFTFSPDGVHANDSAFRVSLQLNTNWFLYYECESSFSVTVNLLKLIEQLKDGNEDKSAKILTSTDGKGFGLAYESLAGIVKVLTLPVEPPLSIELHFLQDFNPYYSVGMRSQQFVNMATFINVHTESITFYCSSSGVSFAFDHGTRQFHMDLPSPDFIGLTPPKNPFEITVRSVDLVRSSTQFVSERIYLHFCFNSHLVVDYELCQNEEEAGKLLLFIQQTL